MIALKKSPDYWTWQLAELFTIETGKIRRIEAILQKCSYGINSGWSAYADRMSDKAQARKQCHFQFPVNL
jgi:hypothetical protein